MLTILFQRSEFMGIKSRSLRARDWHPLVAIAALYLIASAVAPEFGI